MSAPSLPLDIWLIVFEYIDAAYNALDDTDADSLTILWCIIRNVSPYLRDCIDEYFRHGVLQKLLINLTYSNINHYGGPGFAHLHVPMRFSHLSSNGTKVVLHQCGYRDLDRGRVHSGCIRGWVPFMERWCGEMRKPKPQVIHREKAKAPTGLPAWEKEHLNLRNTLSGPEKTNFLAALRDHTSIGRGYRPPFYLKLREAINDTELVDLAVDIEAREISFDWRRTLALFFVEQRFIMLAERGVGKRLLYDADLVAAMGRTTNGVHMQDYWNSSHRRARRKRLQSWVRDNMHRMTPEDRAKAEDRVEHTKDRIRRRLRNENLRELPEFCQEWHEVVLQACAEDLPYLLQWPWIHEDTYITPRKPVQLKCGFKGCSLM
ncbi:hypothetical protein E8E12_005779 [Didymella heteroderae]|uniref:Uncharacterized protein n=1 Tax=Didymella heteroderae TaxID=1769908 RepID=A0A9P4WMI7_9PLEO|nr:hypothetical protein E8E12_005779 [Didymella heteroderae]